MKAKKKKVSKAKRFNKVPLRNKLNYNKSTSKNLNNSRIESKK